MIKKEIYKPFIVMHVT